MEVTNELRGALLRLKNQPELRPFLRYLDDAIESDVSALVSKDDEKAMYRAQGGVRRLKQLRNFIEESHKLPEKAEPGVVKTAGNF